MNKICLNCNYIGLEIRKNYLFAILPILLIWSGIVIFFAFAYVYGITNLIKYFIDFVITPFVSLNILSGLLALIFGYFAFKNFLRNKDGCPKCKIRKMMIPLDTPRAQEIIKENNLTVPTEVPDQTKAPTT